MNEPIVPNMVEGWLITVKTSWTIQCHSWSWVGNVTHFFVSQLLSKTTTFVF